MASNLVHITRRGFGKTARRDGWWVAPLFTFLGLGLFVVYSTWAAFQGDHYTYGPYLSPFYSPEIFGNSPHALLGPKPAWIPAWLPFSPALLILWAPGGFRFTCYYYRGAYYKAFWADPPACAVGEPRNSYWGERTFPLILQNIHRYFLYIALAFLVFLSYDVWNAMWFADPATGAAKFGIGVGTLVLTANVICLGLYTFSCHSLRHLVGGAWDELSNKPVRKAAYGCVSGLNKRHMLFAWISLFVVGFSDIYVRMLSMGVWTDYRFF
ncbi:MAG: succinate dehydrogenase [Acidobacteria bacterium]|nr:succinate dehydrogenase [Acidobacteriota bacterium]MCA1608769.1 succinate dehydrogenase [Acidobacteriota bacterium]